mmetsp:Transcript_21491/g.64294  ORF Transcript_21491/g.64294 Transcript_21491/m.64294 type:complete len:201 (+) Transcript_21491:245-847(+)
MALASDLKRCRGLQVSGGAPAPAAAVARSVSASLSKSAICARGSSDRKSRSATEFLTWGARPSSSAAARSTWRAGVGFGSVTAASAAKRGGASPPLARFASPPAAAPDSLRFRPSPSPPPRALLSSSRGLDMISMGTDRDPRMGASAGPATRMKRWFWWCELRSLMRTLSVAASPAAISSMGLDSSASSKRGTWRFMFLL